MAVHSKSEVFFFFLFLAFFELQNLMVEPEATLETRWAKQISEGNLHPTYPRPQLKRRRWLDLNGAWEYAIRSKGEANPKDWDGKILVPFPVESSLSGVMKRVNEHQRIWYRRNFALPRGWKGGRVLLHFGGVDWETDVWVNGKKVGNHKGGYDPFSFDITSVLYWNRKNEIVVAVWDPTDSGTQSRGKQVQKPGGIFYTPTSGIWQTVWLEPVPEIYIASLRMTADTHEGNVTVEVLTNRPMRNGKAFVKVYEGKKKIVEKNARSDAPIVIKIPEPKLWSPESPYLYRLQISLSSGDRVESYFGMRCVSLGKDGEGRTRIFLNGKPYFMIGVLDQGFFPDGIYTAPNDEALRYDIEVAKKLGFNTIRKHVKVEPARWYYWCDKLGMLVWQDMPSGDRFIGTNDPDIQRTPESAKQFEKELKAMIEFLYDHPSIVMWVVFNEGWGQFDTVRIANWVKRLDRTRLTNAASGWVDRGVGDVLDIHDYPGPSAPPPQENRASVLGEFGGLGFRVEGHTWSVEGWGYKTFQSEKEYTEAFLNLFQQLQSLVESRALSAVIYTQITDVETELNGILTYDRAKIKGDSTLLHQAIVKLRNQNSKRGIDSPKDGHIHKG